MAEQKNEKTKAELEQELEEAGKPTTGTKAELEERVESLSKEHVPDVFVARVIPGKYGAPANRNKMARNSDTALKVIQGADLRRRFRRRVNGEYQPMTGVVARAQIRDKVGGRLLLDLTPYFVVNPDDVTALDLLVPGAATATIATDGVWDVFFDGTYITGGCVDLQRTVTRP